MSETWPGIGCSTQFHNTIITILFHPNWCQSGKIYTNRFPRSLQKPGSKHSLRKVLVLFEGWLGWVIYEEYDGVKKFGGAAKNWHQSNPRSRTADLHQSRSTSMSWKQCSCLEIYWAMLSSKLHVKFTETPHHMCLFISSWSHSALPMMQLSNQKIFL